MNTIETATFSNPVLDVTTDGQMVLLAGQVATDGGDTGLRLPMTPETAMRVLALLLQYQRDNDLPLPAPPVDKDTVQ